MPYTTQEKQRAVARLRRIKGQAEALERAVLAGTDCGTLLQQISALRGATNGLMAEVLESHLRETFGPGGPVVAPDAVQSAAGEVAKDPAKPARKGSGKATGKASTTASTSPAPGPARAADIDRLVRLVRSYLK